MLPALNAIRIVFKKGFRDMKILQDGANDHSHCLILQVRRFQVQSQLQDSLGYSSTTIANKIQEITLQHSYLQRQHPEKSVFAALAIASPSLFHDRIRELQSHTTS